MTVKKIGDKKFKFIDDGECWVCVVTDRYVGEDGRNYAKVKWVQTDQEIDLGSLKKPNTDIIKVQWRLPNKETPASSMLKGLFGGSK